VPTPGLSGPESAHDTLAPRLAALTFAIVRTYTGTKGWQTEAPLGAARGNLGACTVNGRIYAMGGWNGKEGIIFFVFCLKYLNTLFCCILGIL
jgi:hypothetical protein